MKKLIYLTLIVCAFGCEKTEDEYLGQLFDAGTYRILYIKPKLKDTISCGTCSPDYNKHKVRGAIIISESDTFINEFITPINGVYHISVEVSDQTDTENGEHNINCDFNIVVENSNGKQYYNNTDNMPSGDGDGDIWFYDHLLSYYVALNKDDRVYVGITTTQPMIVNSTLKITLMEDEMKPNPKGEGNEGLIFNVRNIKKL